MAFLAMICLGLVASTYLPVNLLPDMDIPRITVKVDAPSYSARELDGSIMKPLRMSLMQVNRLSDLKIISRNGHGSVSLDFEYGTNIDLAYIAINEMVDKASASLPANVPRPVVIKAGASDVPVFYLDVFYKEHLQKKGIKHLIESDENEFVELSNFADEVIRRRIEQIPQVAMADITGRASPEIIITPEIEKIRALNLPVEKIDNIIRDNINASASLSIRDKQFRYNLKYENRLLNADDIGKLHLLHEGRVWQLKDLCSIETVSREAEGKVFSAGERAISIAIIKQSDARMRQLKNELYGMVETLKAENSELEFLINRDQTALLDYTLSNLNKTLLIGAGLAFLVMMLFLGDARSPWLIIISVPAALIISLLFFYLAGISLNIISISGLILCIGMMIDNAVIVIDNMNRHRENGANIYSACVAGTREVFSPLLSSVLTTCSVFIPLIFLGGLSGALFYDQAMAVSIGLLTSLIIAVSLVPVYYHLLHRNKKSPLFVFSFVPQRFSYRSVYAAGFSLIMRRQYVVWTTCVLLIGGMFLLFNKLEKNRFPEIPQSAMLLWVDWNEPIHLNENQRRVNVLMDSVKTHSAHVNVQLGMQQYQIANTHNNNQQQALVYLLATSPGELEQTREMMTAFFVKYFPAALFRYESDGNLFDHVFESREHPLELRLKPTKSRESHTVDCLQQTINALKQHYPGLDLDPIPLQQNIRLKVNMEMLAIYDIEFNALQKTITRNFNKNQITTLLDGSLQIPVRSGSGINDIDLMLQKQSVRSRNGVDIPLRLLLKPVFERDLQFLVSGREGSYFPVKVNAIPEKLEEVTASVVNTFRQDNLYEGSFAGSVFTDEKHLRELIIIGLVALLLLFFILAAQFESLKQPFIVLLEVPLAITGALLMLQLFGESLNIMSLIGLIVMTGIIINDSILKIDTINRLRAGGMSMLRALYTAGKYRLKPILITSITTICALLPFLFVGGLGGSLQKPLALAVIGGLLVGTFISLFFIPVFYFYLYKSEENVKN
jgi:multidrug efflux pump subunit AcrB